MTYTTAFDGYIAGNRLEYTDMIELIKLGAKVEFADCDGALLSYDWLWSMSARTLQTAERLMKLIPEDVENVVAHEAFYLEQLNERFGFNGTMAPCYQAVYTGGPMEVPDVCEIRPLTEEQLPIVVEHYRMGSNVEYMKERIGAGMLGAFIDGECAGFIGTHDEGSMGMLEVLPQYRRRGLAVALEIAMINDRLARGFTPFGQIFEGNEASMALQRKVGMTFCRGRVYWRFRED